MDTRSEMARMVEDARRRTFALVADLTDQQLIGPKLAIVNPLHWEVGHVAWFQERWVLRHALGRAPLRADGDTLYDSSTVPHDTRWDLPLPSREETLRYLLKVRDLVQGQLVQDFPEAGDYFVRLAIAHEDMHDEAFVLTRQTLGYPVPAFGTTRTPPQMGGPFPGDARVPGGKFALGAAPGSEPFIHDNEKWAHPVQVQPFAIARAPVTQSEFAAFVEAGGY